jgi:hypothetical protein
MRFWLYKLQAKIHESILQEVINEPLLCLFNEVRVELPAPVHRLVAIIKEWFGS